MVHISHLASSNRSSSHHSAAASLDGYGESDSRPFRNLSYQPSSSSEDPGSRNNSLIEKDKVIIVNPTTSMSHKVKQKLTQFCTEKLLQNKRRVTKLYGRQKEIRLLMGELDKTVESECYRSLCLISGLSGEGKTALALSIKDPAKRRGAFFLQGKFDLASIGEPYSGVKAAIRQLCRELAELPRRREDGTKRCSNKAAKVTREDIQDCVTKQLDTWELELLCQVVPELQILTQQDETLKSAGRLKKLVSVRARVSQRIMSSAKSNGNIGAWEQKATKDAADMLNPNGASRASVSTINYANAKSAGDRLQDAMRKLIRLVSSFVPLVFLCDDAQFADKTSLSILKTWITDDQIPSLMLLWTYRSNMVDSSHFVTKTIEEIKDRMDRDNKGDDPTISRIHEIAVGELQQADINEMIADILDVTPQKAKELTNIIHQKTMGNAFFVFHCLLSLTQKELLNYNMGSCQWTWDVQDIVNGSTATDNVVDLMREKLEQSFTAKWLLPLAACVGNTFDFRVLQAVMNRIHISFSNDGEEIMNIFVDVLGSDVASDDNFSQSIEDQLRRLESEGFIEATSGTTFSFVHDKVLESAISLIPEDKLDDFKYAMGYILLQDIQNLEAQGVEELTFFLVNLMNPQLERVPLEKRMELFELNWAAAEEAHVAAAFRRSAMYYEAAISLLPDDHWEIMPEESIYLHTVAAESEMCLGNYDRMKLYSDVVLLSDIPIHEKIPVYRIIMDGHMANSKVREAANECLDVLRSLGCPFSKNMLGVRTKLAVANIKQRKETWKPDSLNALPISSDPVDEAISQLHDSLILFAMMTWPEAWPLIIITACRHVLDRGLTRYSAIPLAWMTILIQNIFADFQWAKEHAEVTLSLVDKFQNKETESRISLILNVYCVHWSAPIQQSGKLLAVGYKRGMECCDTDSAFWNAHFVTESALYSGSNLALLEKDLESYTKTELDYKMFKHADCAKSMWQLVLNLRGLSSNTTTLTGTVHDEAAMLQMLNTSRDLHHLSHLQKDRMFGAIFFGDFELASEIGLSNIDIICNALQGQHSTLVSRFILGVACYEMAQKKPKKKKEYIREAKKQRKQIRQWSEMGCPNAHHYVLFLEAENASCKGKTDDAITFYQRAISLAARTGYLHDRALACERLATLYLRIKDSASAKSYLIESRNLSEEWGATKRVEILDKKLSALLA